MYRLVLMHVVAKLCGHGSLHRWKNQVRPHGFKPIVIIIVVQVSMMLHQMHWCMSVFGCWVNGVQVQMISHPEMRSLHHTTFARSAHHPSCVHS